GAVSPFDEALAEGFRRDDVFPFDRLRSSELPRGFVAARRGIDLLADVGAATVKRSASDAMDRFGEFLRLAKGAHPAVTDVRGRLLGDGGSRGRILHAAGKDEEAEEKK